MTVEELRVEAKKLGYYLLKPQAWEKLLPCTCGCQKRGMRYYQEGVALFCKKCGREAVVGKSERDARRRWNEMIRGSVDGGQQR